MNRLFTGTKNLFLSKQRTIISSTLIVASTIILSRLFGFLRYRVLAGYFGKEELDIFFASFRIPDIVFELLITGALTTSFVPIFIKYQKNKEDLDVNISSIINITTGILFLLILVLFFTADWIIPLITPGFTGEKIQSVVFYSKILLLGQLPFLVLSNVLTGLGQANKTFIISSLAPVLYNVVIILVTVTFSSQHHLLAPIMGVVAGASIMFLIQIPLFYSSHFTYRAVLKFTKGLKDFYKLVIPRLITVLVAQIDATIDLTLTTLLAPGSYTIFYLAQHLQLLPVSIIGISFGQASLPYLTEVYQEKKHEEFRRIITESILSILFLTLPIAAFFIFARTPLVRLFFGGDKFDWAATVQTAFTLSYFALAIPTHSLYYFITRCFYAFLDSKTPFYTSLFSIALNVVLSLTFIFALHFPVWSLGLAFFISISANVWILLYMLGKKIEGFDNKMLTVELSKILLVTFLASFFSYWLMKILDGLILDTTRTINVVFLLFFVGLAFTSLYFFLAWSFGIKESAMLVKFMHKAKHYKKRVVEIYTDVE